MDKFSLPSPEKVKVAQLCLTLCASMDYTAHGILGQNAGVGSLSLFQGIFPTQGSNSGLLHCRQIFYQLSYQGSPQRNFPEIELCIAWEIQWNQTSSPALCQLMIESVTCSCVASSSSLLNSTFPLSHFLIFHPNQIIAHKLVSPVLLSRKSRFQT